MEIRVSLTMDMDSQDFGEAMGNFLGNALKWAKTRVILEIERLRDTRNVVGGKTINGRRVERSPRSRCS